jgi:hypothetical protein
VIIHFGIVKQVICVMYIYITNIPCSLISASPELSSGERKKYIIFLLL